MAPNSCCRDEPAHGRSLLLYPTFAFSYFILKRLLRIQYDAVTPRLKDGPHSQDFLSVCVCMCVCVRENKRDCTDVCDVSDV